MKAAVALFAVGLFGAASSAALPEKAVALPSYVKTCQRDQPEFDSCLLSSLQKLLPYLVKGIPELDLPPFDPYKENELITEYVNGHVQAKMAIKDFVTYGLSGMQFLDVRTDFKNEDDMILNVDVFIPKMKSEGKYKVQGKLLGSDIGSRGSYELAMSNISVTWDIHGSLETIDGEKFLKIKEFGMTPEVGDMKIYASDLFNGNEALTKTALSLFNQYWRPVFAEILPYARESWDKVLRGIANRVFLRVPFDQIFPVSSGRRSKTCTSESSCSSFDVNCAFS